jgi:hypothetical protein
VWADNNFVRTLSNFHLPVVLRGGMRRRVRDPVTKRRAREQTDVDCNEQQADYCHTYHQIDKGNGAEAKYDLSTESHLHGWGLKLAARYFNMNINNAYKVYCYLYKKHHPDEVVMPLKDCIHNLTHSLLQRGYEMRQRGYGAPSNPTKDISSSTSSDGRSIRKDSKKQRFVGPAAAHGTSGMHTGARCSTTSTVCARAVYHQRAAFKKRKRLQPDRVHQSIPCIVRGKSDVSESGVRCMYKKCRGLDIKSNKRIVSYKTIYQCEECTAERGSPLWLCHTTKKLDGKHTVVSCHLRYHAEGKFIVGGTESSIVSNLTEE